MSFDISAGLAPKSDQMDAVDLVAGPRTFTVAGISNNNKEQPYNVALTEFPRPWRPSKSMLRVLAACWGTDASQWMGKRLTLFCDPDVEFGGAKVGGIRVSHVSGINEPKRVSLLIKRGKSAPYVVDPLPDPTPADQIASLRAEWGTADDARRAEIEAEVAALQKGGQ